MSKTIQIKRAPEALKARLQASAERNCRSLNQEALARLQFSFEIEDALVSRAHQRWIHEAMAGDFKRGSSQRLKRIAAEVLRRRGNAYPNPSPLTEAEATRIYAPEAEADARELAMARACLRSVRKAQ